jgi:glycosyltransferase involved in cell wall biosynthesis
VFLRKASLRIRLHEFRIVEPIGEQLSRFSDEAFRVPSLAPERIRKRGFGVNLAGYFTGQFGIAASSRAFANALELAEVPHTLNNFVSRRHGEKRKVPLAFSEDNPYAINLVHVNVNTLNYFFQSKGPSYFEGRYNIGIWYWELSRFPSGWVPAFKLYNEIWTTSSFTTKCLSKISPIPILTMKYPLWIDKALVDKQVRKKFGLEKDVCVFLFIFDFGSVLERKNPFSLLKAFRIAFDGNDKVLLVLNCVNSSVDRAAAAELQRQSSDLNVRILREHLSEGDYFSLIAACDCYVSLHRSEGLGLPCAEAMYMGKPVIATAYGGNTDFMKSTNSLLVKYDLVALDRDYGPYEKGNVWAQPNIEHAAQLMRWVYENRNEAREIGQRASSDIERYMDPVVASREIRMRLEKIHERLV